jgi:hypothetical protein
MKVKRLLDELKEYYNSIPWIGLEAIDSTPAFSKLDNCAFFAAIKTLTTEELKEARQILFHDKYPSVLLYIIDECLNPKPYNIYNKNETIDTLIKRFLDKKSKRVIESRKELQARFNSLNFAEQKKIVKAFLASPTATDRDWAAVEADKRWDKSYVTALADAYIKKQCQKLAITIIRHMPIEFVKEYESSLVMFSRVEFCIRLSSNLESLRSKYDISFFEYLYIAARSGIKIDKTEDDIDTAFFRQVFEFCIKSMTGVNPTYCQIDNIPWIRRAVWALGELGYDATILKFLQMKSFCVNEPYDDIDKTQLYFAHKWIINHYFPDAEEFSWPPYDKVKVAVENFRHPRSIKVNRIEDLEGYDDLPPDTIKFLSDFI